MIETARLRLRNWRDYDLAPLAAMCADPEVMRHLDGPIGESEAAAGMQRLQAAADRDGLTFWAVERRADGACMGFCGVRSGGCPGTSVADELEIGWRLARPFWRRGYAEEAARAALAHGWAVTDRARLSAWTVPANVPSWSLMRKIGMVARPDLDFDHPQFPKDHPLSRHVVYTIDRPHGR